jgi:predicted kinase
MPTLSMLVGVPSSGKSTWVKSQRFDPDTVIASTDDIIEREAAAQGKTYSEVFRMVVKRATREMNQLVRQAVAQDQNLVWDQTNTTVKSRASKLAAIPDHYRKIAVFFPTPEPKELDRRLATRPGKTIPWNIVQGMASQLEAPTVDEGFDEVVVVS